MEKQTAVEWLMRQSFGDNFRMTVNDYQLYLFLKAKEMERVQIENSYLNGVMHPLEMEATKQSEQYYNETYKK